MDAERLFRLTRELVAIDSVTGGEGPIVAFLEDELRGRGLQTRTFEVFPQRPNLLACIDGAEPRILLNTHVDTVPPPYGPHEDAERLYGRGSCDTHGILAAMLEALEDLRAEGIDSVGLIAVVDEESGEHAGARQAGRDLDEPAALIVGEPTDNRLVTFQKGLLKADLIADGVEGHSGYPECFDSALDRLRRGLRHLETQGWLERDSRAGTTLNVHIRAGGDAYNKVPGHATAGLFFRLAEPLEVIRGRVDAALAELDDPALRIAWLGGNDPVDHFSTVPGIDTTVAAYNTDVAHFAWAQQSHVPGRPGVDPERTSRPRRRRLAPRRMGTQGRSRRRRRVVRQAGQSDPAAGGRRRLPMNNGSYSYEPRTCGRRPSTREV